MSPRVITMYQLSLYRRWERVPIGTPVVVTRDDRTLFHTETRSAPWVLGGHTAVILVKGILGAYSLDRLQLEPKPLPPPEPQRLEEEPA